MRDVETLRALLADAQEFYAAHPCCDVQEPIDRIKAALAEPLRPAVATYPWVADENEKIHQRDAERVVDEARAEVEYAYREGGAVLKQQRDEAIKKLGVTLEQLWATEKERDEARAEVERLTQALAMAEQVSGVLCDDCGWAMKFPNEPCRCEVVKQRDVAYQRGAEAMREAAARHFDKTYGVTRNPQEVIRALPIPKETP
jgi:hypothetical protein